MTEKAGTAPTANEAVLSIGTCGGRLAQARAAAVGDRISQITGGKIELVTVPTEHAGESTGPTETASDTGGSHPPSPQRCLAGMRQGLRNGEFTLAVHALADVPSAPEPQIRLGAIIQRLDARDVLCAKDGLTLAELAPGARVGAASARRVAQLGATRPDLVAVEAEHDATVLIDMVEAGELDAAVVSAADLAGANLLDDLACEFLELSDWPTAPGQGALALEAREEDATGTSLIRALLARLDHRPSRTMATAERIVKERLEAQTDAAFGVYAILDGSLLLLSATVYDVNGTRQITSSHGVALDGMSPAESKVAVEALGRSVAGDLVRNGATEFTSTGVFL